MITEGWEIVQEGIKSTDQDYVLKKKDSDEEQIVLCYNKTGSWNIILSHNDDQFDIFALGRDYKNENSYLLPLRVVRVIKEQSSPKDGQSHEYDFYLKILARPGLISEKKIVMDITYDIQNRLLRCKMSDTVKIFYIDELCNPVFLISGKEFNDESKVLTYAVRSKIDRRIESLIFCLSNENQITKYKFNVK